MAQESTNFPRLHRQISPLQHHRPMLLKDFLRDDAPKSTALSSSKSNSSHVVLLRSWSKRAAATRISAVHKVIKLLHFASSKSPSVLPRSISRRLTKRGKEENDVVFGHPPEVKVKVKDILRWRSFRDLAEDDPTPSDFPPSPYRSTSAATTATTTTTSCSKRSSWCDSDFTAGELPPWGGESEEFWGKNAAATLKNAKGDWTSSFEEYEQQSPVSVLDSPFQQFTHFHPILEIIQNDFVGPKCESTRRTPKPEIAISTAEEKAKQLLRQVKEEEELYTDEEHVIFDFFVDELSVNGKFDDDEFNCKISRIAESWIDGELEESYEWEVEEERASFVKDMEKGICWNKFEEEQRELCEELEVRVLDSLMDDLVLDFLAT